MTTLMLIYVLLTLKLDTIVTMFGTQHLEEM